VNDDQFTQELEIISKHTGLWVSRGSMLSRILAIYEQDPGVMCLEEVAQKLGREPSVVEGMLETLVKLGKLVEIGSEVCDLCPASSMCILISSARRTFTLASRVPLVDTKVV